MKLNKQLIEKLAKGEVAIDYVRNQNLELLKVILQEAFSTYNYNYNSLIGTFKYYEKYPGTENWSGRCVTNKLKVPLINFLEKEETFPIDDFGVIVENNNGKEIIDYLVSKGFKNSLNQGGTASNSSFYYIAKKTCEIRYNNTNPTSKTYTLEQLKQLDMENKEIEYYEVLQECFMEEEPKYKKGDKLKVNNWGGTTPPLEILDVKKTYHKRINEYCWGYKMNGYTGLTMEYVPEGYLRT